MKLAPGLLATFALVLTAETPLAGEPGLLAGTAPVCPSMSQGSSDIAASHRPDLVRVQRRQADTGRIDEYLSFHANAVEGIGVTGILPGQQLRSASN
jgi:hypothetical protein